MASDEGIEREAANLLVDRRARSARADLERHLIPDIPDLATLRARTRRRRHVSGGAPVDALVAGARLRRPLLLVAAVVVLIAGVGISFALDGSSRESVEVTSAGDPDSTATPLDDPNDVWGRVWNLESLTINGQVIEVPAETGVKGGAPHLDLREDGLVGFVGCNRMGGPGHVDSDHLVTTSWGTTDVYCDGPLGELDIYMTDLITADPTIELRADHLTLTSGNGVAVLVERG